MRMRKTAHKQMQALPYEEAILLFNALSKYERKQQGYIKWLENRAGYRIQVGDFRVVFKFDDLNNELIVLNISNIHKQYDKTPNNI